MRDLLLRRHIAEWEGCTLCPLHEHHEGDKYVFWAFIPEDGCNPDFSKHGVDLLFIGEGPGATEEMFLEPFVGDAGQLLRETIEKAQDKARSGLTVALANLVLCRPHDGDYKNRTPRVSEWTACSTRLSEFIEILAPLAICALGECPYLALNEILMRTAWDGRRFNWYHPSYIIRRGGVKSEMYPGYLKNFVGMFREVEKAKERGYWK